MTELKPYTVYCPRDCSKPMMRLGCRYWFCIGCRTFVIQKVQREMKAGEGDCM